MINIEYANAYSQVLEILKYISIDDYNKIAKNKIRLFQQNANKEYEFLYNPDKTLDEQNVSKRAKAIIAILFRDYWATPTQREKIITKQNYDRKQSEKEKIKKYNPDNLFKNKEQIAYERKENIQVIKYDKESLFEKVINKIRKVFKI